MKSQRFQYKRLGLLLALSTGLSCVSLGLPLQRALANGWILFQEGNLQPLVGTHTFAGTAGQTVAIALRTDGFSGAVVLIAPNGDEVARNEYYGRTSGPMIVTTLPTSGAYKILAQSPYGQAGTYTVNVRIATAYDLAFSRGVQLNQEGDYAGAIAAFNEAIRADPQSPEAYVELGNLLYNDARRLKPEEARSIVSAYERAAAAYERQGNQEMAQMLRDLIVVVQAEVSPIPSGAFPGGGVR
ncbi:tetratricopeptide repeat protein [Thermoleptolyngbya sp. M55_K2018_002]|uniref:tetratricopeptide repeat protein n=1 Tax=Thermoleptolyngbya sp. M55_K2018_002 TaxID=2747808 RepID=UPI0019EE805A|nr:tetratricopeptide repeat protein [Thermoleptolyngbya sp. M55_K2018_002]HIK39478.1 tetratricopeptide repeat protein [Thermoleptolyngbya sp. M55_K2018_002]